MKKEDIEGLLRDVADFPKPGIVFKDITPLLGHGAAFHALIDLMAEAFAHQRISKVVAVEARGFVFGAALADRLGAGLVLVRKPGKLPYETIGVSYDLEYGQDRLEVHVDAFAPTERALIVDDVLATGGTAAAAIALARKAGAEVVGAAFVIELAFLGGRAKLGETPSWALFSY
ncbi:MAG: adenine phosphoribosyltransferase [Myxococcota bacterium]|jgi:adenine phosphoribosyltransferase|nr:adenine phosphoribosyltransferase [Myxococcota bacterium]